MSFPNGETVILKRVVPSQIDDTSELHAAGIPCFTEGTKIATTAGEIAVEDLRVGDLVQTLNNGPLQLLWIGTRRFSHDELEADPDKKPIHIPTGVLGNHSPLQVSPQHGMLLGQSHNLDAEMLVLARHLYQTRGPVRLAKGCRQVCCFHLMFAQHQILFANGAAAESFYPGPQALTLFGMMDLLGLRALFPKLGTCATEEAYGGLARPFAKRKDVLARVDLRPSSSPAAADMDRRPATVAA
ncbi:Hint domain-containing protein [Parasedimentitalea psychrophila]|uniref:Hint domain-containing protein n=1 Tax=Parasedimentitalea psychrophila TaxID=2997337 RepID=A0A9Y2L0X2_9RHOB|nr:Hint domain-containing protein [Parasedimentitalea psychrophila]WIY25357.1 Hint domain-containing protein [Parasedimentitalea psychrophila]